MRKENDISAVKIYPFEQRLVLYNQGTKVVLLSYTLQSFYRQTEGELKESNYREFIGNHYEHQDRILGVDWVDESRFITSVNSKNIHIWHVRFKENEEVEEIKFEREWVISPISGLTIKSLGTGANFIGVSNSQKDRNIYFWDINYRVRPTHIFKGFNKETIKGIEVKERFSDRVGK